MNFSEAELFAKKTKPVTTPTQLTYFGNKVSHLLSGWFQKREKRKRIAPPLGASAAMFHHSTNSLQHKSLTSGEDGGHHGQKRKNPQWSLLSAGFTEDFRHGIAEWRHGCRIRPLIPHELQVHYYNTDII